MRLKRSLPGGGFLRRREPLGRTLGKGHTQIHIGKIRLLGLVAKTRGCSHHNAGCNACGGRRGSAFLDYGSTMGEAQEAQRKQELTEKKKTHDCGLGVCKDGLT